MKKNQIKRLEKVKDKDMKLTQMISIFREMKVEKKIEAGDGDKMIEE